MRETWRKAQGLAVLVLLMLLIELSIISLSGSGGIVTTVTADMDDSVEVDVSPGSGGEAVIRGIVTCQTVNPATPVIVSLSTSTTVGTSSIKPPTVTFQGGGTQSEEIEVVIQVPLLTQASDTESCTITGSWQQGGTMGPVESDITQVIILPFYRLTIFSEQPVEEITPGESMDFKMRIFNSGNCHDTYTLTLSNQGDLRDKGISVDCPGQISLECDQASTFAIKTKTSSDTPTRSHSIFFRATSKGSAAGSGEVYEEDFLLVLKVITVKLNCKIIQALQYAGIAAAIIVTGVFVYIKGFRGRAVPAYGN